MFQLSTWDINKQETRWQISKKAEAFPYKQ